jgi:cytochrome c biogenesis DsbD-like protein
MNLYAILLTGLVAGGVSWAAVQGGLLTAIVMRQRRPTPASAPTTTGVAAAGPVTRLADDLAPVAGFLAGKLVSHTVLGAVLGALGATMQLSVTVRTLTQLTAGVLVVVFVLAPLGVPGFRGPIIEPAAAWSRLVRGRTGTAPVTPRAAPNDVPPPALTADGTQQVIVTAITGAYRPANIVIDLGVLEPSKQHYSRGMGMYTGRLTVTAKASA